MTLHAGQAKKSLRGQLIIAKVTLERAPELNLLYRRTRSQVNLIDIPQQCNKNFMLITNNISYISDKIDCRNRIDRKELEFCREYDEG